MRKILAKKTQPRRKTPSTKNRVKRREIEPKAHVIERKSKKTPVKAKAARTGSTTAVRRKSPAKKVRSTTSSRQAKSVGQAVGKVLGRAIGTVERAFARAATIAEMRKK